MTTPLLKGFLLCFSMIVSIGPQNTFVIRQGFSGLYVGLTVLVCVLCEALLVGLGLFGFGTIAEKFPRLVWIMQLAAVVFLLGYGFYALMGIFKKRSILIEKTSLEVSRKKVITLLLGFSLLNPHVYLDTVVLIGSAGLKYQGTEKLLFGIGVVLASAAWFSSIALGAKSASKAMNNPTTWKVIDGVTGCCMLFVAYQILPR